MMMDKKLINTTFIVKEILESVPEARNDDNYLYYLFCERVNQEILKKPLGFFLTNRIETGLPSIETVSRCRRKVQEKCPDLKADKPVQQIRDEQEERFREYARS